MISLLHMPPSYAKLLSLYEMLFFCYVTPHLTFLSALYAEFVCVSVCVCVHVRVSVCVCNSSDNTEMQQIIFLVTFDFVCVFLFKFK